MHKKKKQEKTTGIRELKIRDLDKASGGFFGWDDFGPSAQLCTDDGQGWSGSPVQAASHSTQLCTDDGDGWSGIWM